jgi:phosphotransferase system enzyme I (PtsI)
MERIEGKKIFGGIAIGSIMFYSKTENRVVRKKVDDTGAEIARYEDAKEKAKEQLGELYDKAVKEVGEMNAQIFEVHSMMLDDDDTTILFITS